MLLMITILNIKDKLRTIRYYFNINNEYQYKKGFKMSDLQLRLKINRLIVQSGYAKSEELLSPIVKIIKMRHGNIDRDQVLRITKEALK